MKNKILYCNTTIVLQRFRLEGGWFKGKLYCNTTGCIARGGWFGGGWLYHNTMECIVKEEVGLAGFNIATQIVYCNWDGWAMVSRYNDIVS